MVLPGLTSSSVMMALGLYEPMMQGLADMKFWVLSACLPGMLLTMLLLARVVTWLFRRHYAIVSVSYKHLDVYKRQLRSCALS